MSRHQPARRSARAAVVPGLPSPARRRHEQSPAWRPDRGPGPGSMTGEPPGWHQTNRQKPHHHHDPPAPRRDPTRRPAGAEATASRTPPSGRTPGNQAQAAPARPRRLLRRPRTSPLASGLRPRRRATATETSRDGADVPAAGACRPGAEAAQARLTQPKAAAAKTARPAATGRRPPSCRPTSRRRRRGRRTASPPPRPPRTWRQGRRADRAHRRRGHGR